MLNIKVKEYHRGKRAEFKIRENLKWTKKNLLTKKETQM